MLTALFNELPSVKVIDTAIDYKDYVALNLCVSNCDPKLIDANNSKSFEQYINRYLEENSAKAAYGGYIEKRNLYSRSTIFNDGVSQERNIHIGLDIWTAAGTSVLAALDGKVHSFNYNAGIGNYGPTILLEHTIGITIFYTLYGHLSLESIADLEIGQVVKQGETIGTLGDSGVNGDYAPHLHFQIIVDLGEHFGDYPGVCSESELLHCLENCPDPNLLLKIKEL